MDELGLDRALMWPTLASLVEERLRDDVDAIHAVVHALNEWMHETWTFNYEDRIFPTPVITLPIVEEAIKELEWVAERGAKIILVRPAPVPGLRGPRSFALPEFDPFWELVQEKDIVVGMHASDSGYQRYINEWEGIRDEMTPFAGGSGFAGHRRPHRPSRSSTPSRRPSATGCAAGSPASRSAPVENGSNWVRPLLHDLESAYAFNPHLFAEDPVEVFKRNIFVHPFHEEDPKGLVELLGRRQRALRLRLPPPRGHVRPDQLRRRPRGPPRRGHRQGDGRQHEPPDERRLSRPSAPWRALPASRASRRPPAT